MSDKPEPPSDPEPVQDGAEKAAAEPQKPLKIRRGLGLTREQIKAQIARQSKVMKRLE